MRSKSKTRFAQAICSSRMISTEGLFAMEADHRSLLVISHWKEGVESCQILFTVLFEGELPACLITLLNRKHRFNKDPYTNINSLQGDTSFPKKQNFSSATGS
ncbi:uncharacterized protein LOC120901208 [Anopheles arabiensis]|uniref:uncharacterized protein LOC120901208 n=1 Tax=Anopheles arabiensis TaxID=7173 RepID=UPI001AACA58D|nr:uncharacterized protein LOC120901208 [Anopheles arabiensis]